VFCPHSACLCFVLISEQTAIISLYSINLSLVMTEAECLLRRTNWAYESDGISFVLKGPAVTLSSSLSSRLVDSHSLDDKGIVRFPARKRHFLFLQCHQIGF
jgi:hypothetical protein